MPDELIVRDLVKRYGGITALGGVSFSVAAGQIHGLLGRNGAGKTTAVECIIGLRSPDSGDIQIRGHDAIGEPNRVKELIGVQLQQTALQDKITPREAFKFFAAFHAHPAPVGSVIERFSLTEKADAPFDTLSGGQRQRLALALAFIQEPTVLILDEPTAGLDAHSRRQLHAEIRRLRDEGRAILLTTHYIEEAQRLCDRITILDHGLVVGHGSPAELIERAGKPRLEDVFIDLTGPDR